jgi:putative tricarboxylic transport membrane protein
MIDGLILGFKAAFSLQALMYCMLGVSIGTAIGILPGLGPVATISMLMPLTFGIDPLAGMIMLAGIYYGAQYGGSTTAILVNLPGESSSVVTCLDGYQMARKGEAGYALAIAAVGSFIAGTIATIFIAVLSPTLALLALQFGAPEYFSLMVLGLISSVALAHGDILKSLAMIVVGILLGLVGMDVSSGAQRFTLSFGELNDGLSFVSIAMGMFGIAEIFRNLEDIESTVFINFDMRSVYASLRRLPEIIPAVLRGTAIGTFLGCLPGGGAVLSSFAAYTFEKKISKNPSRFGTGIPEGVASPEAANNAGAQTSFIPMLTLGLPSNPVMALMIGALIIHGIQPGPQVMTNQPVLFWGLIASMWIGNIMLLVINLPLVGLWARLIAVPYRALYPSILVFCCIGVFSVNNSPFDLYVMCVFAFLGYIFNILGCEMAPLILSVILGPMLEEYFRRSLLISRGDMLVFLIRPISAVLLVASFIVLIAIALPSIRKFREKATVE